MREPFERTTRYLTADGGGLALAGVSVSLIIVILWLAWLFFAQVPVYVQSQGVQPASGSTYNLNVAPAVATLIKPGQSASFQPAMAASGNTTLLPLAATVVSVDSKSGFVQIKLSDTAEHPTDGTVSIITEHITPATLMMRAVKQLLATP